ncbi:MAG: hypothetical protein ACLFR8_12910 [Alkalispirochaeta sp.]
MPATRLTDMIVPEVYLTYQAEDNPEKTAFFQSGVAVRNEALDTKAKTGGPTVHIPFFRDLDPDSEPNVSNDDPADLAVPEKLTSDEQIGRIAYLNKAYSATDLAGEIGGAQPMQRIRNRFGVYWQRQWQRRVLAAAVGVFADNVANDDGDMVNDVAIEDGNNAAETNLFTRKNFSAAAFTLGDKVDGITAIAVHSMVYQTMLDNEDIEFIPDSEGKGQIATFLGRRVIVDDGMPVVAGGTSGFKYTSILFGPGAIGYGEGTPQVPVAVEREELQGGGGGVETIVERSTWLIHPFGFKVSASPAGQSFTSTELKDAATWDRVFDRKNIPLAALITNG